jgi:hypothetical protein
MADDGFRAEGTERIIDTGRRTVSARSVGDGADVVGGAAEMAELHPVGCYEEKLHDVDRSGAGVRWRRGVSAASQSPTINSMSKSA